MKNKSKEYLIALDNLTNITIPIFGQIHLPIFGMFLTKSHFDKYTFMINFHKKSMMIQYNFSFQ